MPPERLDGGRPLRVLQICSSSATSGAENNVLQLSRTLVARGHSVSAVVPSPGWLPDRLAGSGIPVRVQGMKGLGWYRLMGMLVKEARAGRVDVAHTHLTRAAYFGHTFGLLTGTPIVTSVHIANNDNIYRRLARGQNRLVAVSDFVRGMLHGRGVPEGYVTTVHNGTDMLDRAGGEARVVRASLGIPEGRTVIGMVGRVCPEKGHPEAIEALRTLVKGGQDAHLLLVGREVPEFQRAIRASVSGPLEGRVTFAGERDDVPALLDASDLAAMPSVMETFGIAALEAMARARPVVATRVGGLPEVVQDGATGLLVEPDAAGLAGALAGAFDRLLSHPAEREAMGRNGREVVRAHFTLEKMAGRFEGVYERALSPA